MSDAEEVPPSLPPEPAASLHVAGIGCVVACGLALLPLLYIGSFAYLTFDAWNHWGVMDSLDPRTVETLSAFYAPLIWFCEEFIV